MEKVFISGSIGVKQLPVQVITRLNNMIGKFHIFVGDADGIDAAVQNYFKQQNYFELTVYSIYDVPRVIKSEKFNKKQINVNNDSSSERVRQQEKDAAMTKDSHYSFVIWDGKSTGSFNNICRAMEQSKPVLVFYTRINDFLPKEKITLPEISYIYYELNGYTGKEIIEVLASDIPFKSTRELNKYLRDNKIIEKKDGEDVPCKGFENLFIVEMYRGKVAKLKFSMEFTEWIIEHSKNLIAKSQDSFFE